MSVLSQNFMVFLFLFPVICEPVMNCQCSLTKRWTMRTVSPGSELPWHPREVIEAVSRRGQSRQIRSLIPEVLNLKLQSTDPRVWLPQCCLYDLHAGNSVSFFLKKVVGEGGGFAVHLVSFWMLRGFVVRLSFTETSLAKAGTFSCMWSNCVFSHYEHAFYKYNTNIHSE